MDELELKELNKKICELDRVIAVEVYTESNQIKYREPNRFQREIGITQSINNETEKSNFIQYENLDFLASVINDLCQQKNFPTNFLEEYEKINAKLASKEFELSEGEKFIASMSKDMNNLLLRLREGNVEQYESNRRSEYPTYKTEKLKEAFNYKLYQVLLLIVTFCELTEHIVANGLDTNCTYINTYTSNWYEDSTTTKYVVKDSYMKAFESIIKCGHLMGYNKQNLHNVETGIISKWNYFES